MTLHKLFMSVLDYDPVTGVLTWKVTVNGRAPKGARAGTLRPDGRRQVRIGGKLYLEHRLIWFMVTGTWPDPEVDHRNRKPADNRWHNLREATRIQNTANHGGKKHKASGLPVGVYHDRNGRVRACVTKEGKQHYVGSFETVDEAVVARREASLRRAGAFSVEAFI